MLCPGLLLAEYDVERTRGGAVVVAARVAPEGPFHPGERDAQKEESDEVRDNKCAAAVGGRLYGESEEVAKPDCRTRDSEDDSYLGAPVFTFLTHALKFKQICGLQDGFCDVIAFFGEWRGVFSATST